MNSKLRSLFDKEKSLLSFVMREFPFVLEYIIGYGNYCDIVTAS